MRHYAKWEQRSLVSPSFIYASDVRNCLRGKSLFFFLSLFLSLGLMLAREISRNHIFTRPCVKRAARSHDVPDQPSFVRFLCTCQAPSVICCSLRQAIPSVKVCIVLSLARHVVRLCGLRSWVMLASMVITREFLLSFLIPHRQDIPVFIAIASRG